VDIIYKTEWEYLKSQSSIWNKYEKPIPYDDRDLGVFDVGYGVVLPKFFVQYNHSELAIDKVGAEILRRHNLAKEDAQIAPVKLKKMVTSIEARKEQIPVFKAIKDAMLKGSINGLIVAQPGFGKQQPYSEPILTPNGWVTMGELKIGSFIVGKNGTPTKVTHIHEHGISDVYKITFQDGTYTKCGIDHLWTVKNRHKITNKNKGWETIDTSKILKNYKSGRYKTKYGTYQQEYKYKINLCDEVQYTKRNLKLKSFAMGALIADGSFRGDAITFADLRGDVFKEVFSQILEFDSDATYSIINKYSYRITSLKLKQLLKSYKLMDKLSIDKSIPDDYIFASVDERKEFLRAYLLTDSYHQSKNSKILYSSSKKLINQLQHIVRSLGIYANEIRIKPEPKFKHKGEICIGHEAYEFMININPKKNTKTIVNIEKLDYQENSRCITIDAKDHLYITRDFTVTHNSIVAIKTVELVGTKSLIIVPNDILEGQFVESIIEFTNLEKDDIGIAQGSDINALIKKCVFEKDIVVAKIQSLYAQLKNIDINILVELYSAFGLVIYDEAHVGNASDGYSKTACMFSTDNVLSMTATPYRVGINEFLFMNNTGGILYKSDHQNLVPKINLHNGIIEFTEKEIQRLVFSRTDYVRFMATYNMILETKEVYFEWIANWVEYRIKDGHKTAILFATNKMVRRMAAVLERRGIDVGVIIGETKKKLDESKEYLTPEQVQSYYDHYFEVFPKRKKCVALKLLKGEDDKYSLTKPILKDIAKVQATIPTLDLKTSWTIADNRTEREIMKAKDTLVSNFKLLSAGFDKSDLSAIIFGSLIVGKVPVIQSLGRITRIDKSKNQDIQAHFMFTQQFMNFFPDMLHILVNNIKTQYPSEFSYEGFDFG